MRSMILGHRGMVGSAIHRLLPDALICPDLTIDLSSQDEAALAMRSAEGVDVLYLCAARVGGIGANMAEPGRMIYDNLTIQTNVIEWARLCGVKLIVFLGSSCIYPANAAFFRRINEKSLMGGWLEPTNEPYAIAKIAGIKMLEAYNREYGMEYLAVMPCNLYGPGDNFDVQSSHFLPGMMRKFHDAEKSGGKAVLWGSGEPLRELMHVDDCAQIMVRLVEKGARGLVNIGWGRDMSIRAWANTLHDVMGCSCRIEWDRSKPDGVRRKLLDVSRMKSFGVGPRIESREGLASTYRWFLGHAC